MKKNQKNVIILFSKIPLIQFNIIWYSHKVSRRIRLKNMNSKLHLLSFLLFASSFQMKILKKSQ